MLVRLPMREGGKEEKKKACDYPPFSPSLSLEALSPTCGPSPRGVV